ncbi:MAG: ArsI/CadI family heavy metal resistance metalloenzyme [Pseudomonadota bacterium]
MKRVHIHVGVNDMQESLQFYSALFNVDPHVCRDDYAKWMLDDPQLNFVISQGHAKLGIEHVGIESENDDEFQQMRERMLSADNIATVEENETHCCYARSNKTWTSDPQKVVWESFHSYGAADSYYGERPAFSIPEQITRAESTSPTCCGR